MFELPFLMLVHKNIDLGEIPNLPDFENEISKNYATEYLDLYKELALAVNNGNEEMMQNLRPKISKCTSKGVKLVDKMGGNDMQKLAGWFIELLNN